MEVQIHVFVTRYKVMASDRIHEPASLLLGKVPLYVVDCDWTPEQLSTKWGLETYLNSCRESSGDVSDVQTVI